MRTRLLYILLLTAAPAAPQQPYGKPPKEIVDILNAPSTPAAIVSPARDWIALRGSRPNPPIAVLALPMLRLAGIRIDPATNGLHNYLAESDRIALMRIDGSRRRELALPPNPRILWFEFSPNGTHFAFLHSAGAGIELWTGDTASATVRHLARVTVNAVLDSPARWMPDSRRLLVKAVPALRGKPPAEPAIPSGPHVQESEGKERGSGTFEDLLRTPHDEDLFDYCATAQLALVDDASGAVTPLGKPAILATAVPAPDGRHFLIARVHRPYSYLHRHTAFPREVEVWDLTGKPLHTVASQPLHDNLPLDGVAPGPRQYGWRPGAGATLVWMESKSSGGRGDRVLAHPAPFAGKPSEIATTADRCAAMHWTESGRTVFLTESNRIRHTTRTLVLDAEHAGSAARPLFARNSRDAYRHPARSSRERVVEAAAC